VDLVAPAVSRPAVTAAEPGRHFLASGPTGRKCFSWATATARPARSARRGAARTQALPVGRPRLAGSFQEPRDRKWRAPADGAALHRGQSVAGQDRRACGRLPLDQLPRARRPRSGRVRLRMGRRLPHRSPHGTRDLVCAGRGAEPRRLGSSAQIAPSRRCPGSATTGASLASGAYRKGRIDLGQLLPQPPTIACGIATWRVVVLKDWKAVNRSSSMTSFMPLLASTPWPAPSLRQGDLRNFDSTSAYQLRRDRNCQDDWNLRVV